MQKNIYCLLFLGILFYSCSNSKKEQSGALNDKKAILENLKNQQKNLNTEISTLEADLAKSDTGTTLAKNAKLVALTTIQPGNFSHYIDLEGKIDAVNISYVAPANGQGGIVKQLYIRQGQAVTKGQVLATLDDEVLRQNIEPLRVQLFAAEDTYKRTKNLFDQGIGTYQQVLTAKTQVETLQKNIAVINKQISMMTVRAPYSGIADLVNVRIGEAFTGVSAAGPQIRVVNTNDLKVTAQVPENYLDRVHIGSTVEILLPDENNRTLTAVVTVAGRIIDPNSRSFYIEAKIPSKVSLKPNQLAKVRIRDYENKNAIAIPVSTLQNDEKGKYVLVAVSENGKLVARKRSITVGELYGDSLEVKAGLPSGNKLITEGFQGLYDGQLITTEVK